MKGSSFFSFAQKAWDFIVKYNHFTWKIVFSIQFIVVVVIAMRLTTALLGGGEKYDSFHNSYCLDNNGKHNDVNGTEPCSYDYKFKKVVFFWCDGISWDTADPIFNVFPDNNNLFKVRHRENPWSAWVFSTLMTGKAERNMGDVSNDNLLYQFFLAGMKVLIGTERTRAYVFDQLDTRYSRNGMVRYSSEAYFDNKRMFTWLFGCDGGLDAYQCASNIMDQGKLEDRSMFFESFLLDHYVHGQLSKYDASVLGLRDQLAKDMVAVKKWVDDNPEYLLVLVSDHGQITSPKDMNIHGDWLANGNEGWMMFYNPSLDHTISTAKNPVAINTVDMAPTLWQFVGSNGVSIPAESAGRVHPISRSSVTKFRALKTNALQIRAYIDKESLFTYSEDLWNEANSAFEAGKYDQAVESMDKYLSGFTDKYYAEGGKIPFLLPVVTCLCSLAGALCLQFVNVQSFKRSVRIVGIGLLAAPYAAWVIMAVFFSQSMDSDNRHQVYTYTIPMIAFICSYTFKKASRRSPLLPETKDGHKLIPVKGFELMDRNTLHESDDDLLRNPATEDDVESLEKPQYESSFFYVEVGDLMLEKNFKDAICVFINYIIGNTKMPRRSMDMWLMYCIVFFGIFACIELSFGSKRFLFDDMSNISRYPVIWKTIAYAILFFEFRWQRILLSSNLDLGVSRICSLKKIFHPAFWPLNLKMIAYFILLHAAFEAENSTARALYVISFVHIGLLLLCPTYLQRDLFLPLFILSILLNTNQDRILLCMYVTILHFLSNSLQRPSLFHRLSLPSIIILMIGVGHYYFSVLYKTPYTINQLSLKIPGIEDVTLYPNFSVLMMGFHYSHVFLMLIPFLIRLSSPSPPPLAPLKIFRKISFGHVPTEIKSDEEREVEGARAYNRRFIMTLLVFFVGLTVPLYYLFSTSTVSDIPLVWCFMLCIITIGYGATVVCAEVTDGIVLLFKFVKNR